MIGVRAVGFFVGSVLFLLCATVAVFALRLRGGNESTPALRGEVIARRLGCFACHGSEGKGGILDPGARGGTVPGWDGSTVATYARDEQEIREWILDGAPQRLAKSGIADGRPAGIPMPAYRGRISSQELADLLVYFRAVSAFGTEIPEAAYEGRRVASRLGCFGCYGPSGIGAVSNPGSLKGHIPAWDGEDFVELVRDDAELREWILDGHPERLWNDPAARHFLEGQTIKMPAYRRHLTEDETAKLVAYIRWLRNIRR